MDAWHAMCHLLSVTCHLILKDAHTYRTGSDASHHSFSFTAKARPPDTDSQRGSTLSPRGSQGGIPLAPKIAQPTSSRELHTSAKPRPDSSFAIKVSHSYMLLTFCYSPSFFTSIVTYLVVVSKPLLLPSKGCF